MKVKIKQDFDYSLNGIKITKFKKGDSTELFSVAQIEKLVKRGLVGAKGIQPAVVEKPTEEKPAEETVEETTEESVEEATEEPADDSFDDNDEGDLGEEPEKVDSSKKSGKDKNKNKNK